MIHFGQAGSVGELLSEVNRIGSEWAPGITDLEEIWFRGEHFRKHALVPTLYRSDKLAFHYDESNLFERFRALGAPYVRRTPADDWDWYFLARHHGLPSRLLDWSESLLVATYFALSGHMSSVTRLDFAKELMCAREIAVHDPESPCIWMLDAGTLNKSSAGDDNLFVPGGERTQLYLPDGIASGSSLNEFPIAILPPRTNERIAAQQGVFTLHGHSKASLESIAEGTTSSPIRLACISLDRKAVCRIWDELGVLGIGRLGVFPELDSVAAHISWVCQSSV